MVLVEAFKSFLDDSSSFACSVFCYISVVFCVGLLLFHRDFLGNSCLQNTARCHFDLARRIGTISCHVVIFVSRIKQISSRIACSVNSASNMFSAAHIVALGVAVLLGATAGVIVSPAVLSFGVIVGTVCMTVMASTRYTAQVVGGKISRWRNFLIGKLGVCWFYVSTVFWFIGVSVAINALGLVQKCCKRGLAIVRFLRTGSILATLRSQLSIAAAWMQFRQMLVDDWDGLALSCAAEWSMQREKRYPITPALAEMVMMFCLSDRNAMKLVNVLILFRAFGPGLAQYEVLKAAVRGRSSRSECLVINGQKFTTTRQFLSSDYFAKFFVAAVLLFWEKRPATGLWPSGGLLRGKGNNVVSLHPVPFVRNENGETVIYVGENEGDDPKLEFFPEKGEQMQSKSLVVSASSLVADSPVVAPALGSVPHRSANVEVEKIRDAVASIPVLSKGKPDMKAIRAHFNSLSETLQRCSSCYRWQESEFCDKCSAQVTHTDRFGVACIECFTPLDDSCPWDLCTDCFAVHEPTACSQCHTITFPDYDGMCSSCYRVAPKKEHRFVQGNRQRLADIKKGRFDLDAKLIKNRPQKVPKERVIASERVKNVMQDSWYKDLLQAIHEAIARHNGKIVERLEIDLSKVKQLPTAAWVTGEQSHRLIGLMHQAGRRLTADILPRILSGDLKVPDLFRMFGGELLKEREIPVEHAAGVRIPVVAGRWAEEAEAQVNLKSFDPVDLLNKVSALVTEANQSKPSVVVPQTKPPVPIPQSALPERPLKKFPDSLVHIFVDDQDIGGIPAGIGVMVKGVIGFNGEPPAERKFLLTTGHLFERAGAWKKLTILPPKLPKTKIMIQPIASDPKRGGMVKLFHTKGEPIAIDMAAFCSSKLSALPCVTYRPPVPGEQFYVFGVDFGDKNEHKWDDGVIPDDKGVSVKTRYSTVIGNGSSGTPLYVVEKNGVWKVVGIHTHVAADGRDNIYAPIGPFLN